MQVWVSEEYLPFFEALANPMRIKIIERLAEGEANIKELAAAIGISSAMVTSHIQKLEQAGLVVSTKSRRYGKVCMLVNQFYALRLPTPNFSQIQNYEIKLGVGQYTKAEVEPTCGLADENRIIGGYDEARFFYDPDRIKAQILWFTKGYVEYEIPNYVPEGCKILDIQISAEMCSEYPNVRNDWESDIELSLNGRRICLWRSPGDFGDRKGKFTPGWWCSAQYGILKRFEINQQGIYLDKEQQSEDTLEDFDLDRSHWTLRFAVSEERIRAGGLTIFGERFGDYAKEIEIQVNYEKNNISKKEVLYKNQDETRWGSSSPIQ